jgi:hypothetical protein
MHAKKLIGGLSGEKVWWIVVGIKLGAIYIDLTGNVLWSWYIALGYVAYLGLVTISYREVLLREWVKLVNMKKIPCSHVFKLANVLGNPITICD